MIRLAFMTDKNYVIGASDPETNAARFPMLPEALMGVMGGLYQTRDAVIVGEPSLVGLQSPGFAGKTQLCLTRNKEFQAPKETPNVTPVDDVDALVAEYGSTDKELLVIGGLTVFKLFMPHASKIDVAFCDGEFPGDLVLKGWDEAPFETVKTIAWDGGKTLYIERK